MKQLTEILLCLLLVLIIVVTTLPYYSFVSSNILIQATCSILSVLFTIIFWLGYYNYKKKYVL